MRARTPTLLAVALAGLLTAQGSHGQAATAAPIKSARIPWSGAPASREAWGELRAHFEGETYGLRDALAATAVLKPGQQIHPPHQTRGMRVLLDLQSQLSYKRSELFPRNLPVI